MKFYSTKQVAERLGVTEGAIKNVLRRKPHLKPPVVGKAYVWTEELIEQYVNRPIRRGRPKKQG